MPNDIYTCVRDVNNIWCYAPYKSQMKMEAVAAAEKLRKAIQEIHDQNIVCLELAKSTLALHEASIAFIDSLEVIEDSKMRVNLETCLANMWGVQASDIESLLLLQEC
jgi:hypothetical protein